ncbi:unnamed protein product [Fraxinus pennsylvanica]|uniref:non-specific serine/threonine protein kinase n=1 Tax=Fraxinus pennsylvanica TaxID=56036 RepID=A0AAD1ZZX8_9LAMI|nr:unnamed protein product [Fraxinus pennsylvanica]
MDFSFNYLSGPIPTSDSFRKAPGEAFIENSGLCGNADGLSPCDVVVSSTSKSQNNDLKILMAVIVPVVSLIILAITIVGCLIFRSKTKRNYDETKTAPEFEDLESLIWEREGNLQLEILIKQLKILVINTALEVEDLEVFIEQF